MSKTINEKQQQMLRMHQTQCLAPSTASVGHLDLTLNYQVTIMPIQQMTTPNDQEVDNLGQTQTHARDVQVKVNS